MKISNFTKGLISVSTGSFFWGFLGTLYFQFISFIGFIEVVVHRSIWTLVILLITTTTKKHHAKRWRRWSMRFMFCILPCISRNFCKVHTGLVFLRYRIVHWRGNYGNNCIYYTSCFINYNSCFFGIVFHR